MHWLTATDVVPANDRGLAYGDGLFETMRVRSARIPWLARHLARLQIGLQRLAIAGVDLALVECRLQRLAAESAIDAGWLKLIVTRGSGERGYRAAGSLQPRLIVQTGRTAAAPEALRLIVCKTLVPLDTQLAGIKHLNRLPQVLGAAELAGNEADEGLMCNPHGELVCGIMHNVFIVTDNRVLTPSLAQGGVAGIMRDWVIDTIDVDIQAIRPQALSNAQEVFVTNAVRGVRSASHISGTALPDNTPVADQLRDRLERAWQ
ncbi:MAG: aminodeoxychorismate lyase [Pseudomonadota bacterium]